MTRQELETLASEKPQELKELSLLFAQKVAGFPDAVIEIEEKFYYHVCNHGNENRKRLPDYLTDWTAVINAGKKVGIEWDKMDQEDGATYWAFQTTDNSSEAKGIQQQPDWPDCAALMIVMIEAIEAK